MSEFHHKKPSLLPAKHRHLIDYIAEANALVSGFALYPQLFKVICTHEAESLSPITFGMIGSANTMWIMYGFHRKDVAVITSSSLVTIAAGSLFVLSILW